MNSIPTIKNIPAHVRASWTKDERQYYEAVYDRPRIGPEWVIAHRKIEVRLADRGERDFIFGYFPEEALDTLENFKRKHFDTEPDKVFSTIGDRLKLYYPDLFKMLDCRMAALSEAADTHPQLLPIWKEYENLKATYWRMLHAAEVLTQHIEPPRAHKKKRHDYYREAFVAVYPKLHRLISDLIVIAS